MSGLSEQIWIGRIKLGVATVIGIGALMTATTLLPPKLWVHASPRTVCVFELYG